MEQLETLLTTQLKSLKPEELQDLANRAEALNTHKIALYTPYDKQAALHKAGKDHNIRAFFAGNRCGKSYAGMMEDTYHLTGLYPDWWEGHRFTRPINMWAASDTSTTTRDILQKGLLGDSLEEIGTGTIPLDLIDIKSVIKIPNGTGAIDSVRVKHASGGYSKLAFKSYEQGRAKFQGTNQHWIHLDEEPPQDVYTECVTRTANVKGKVLLTMTPLSGVTPLMDRFMNGVDGKPLPSTLYLTATWEDNPYLSEDMKETLKGQYLPHEIEARTKGIPSIGEGKVYPVLEDNVKFTPTGFPPHFIHTFGMDFGWYDTSVVIAAYDKDTDILYIYDCYKEGADHKTPRSPAEHYASFPAIARNVKGVCDPSGGGTGQATGEQARKQYEELGMTLVSADNARDSGILEVLQRLQSGRLKIADTPNMDKWWHEFRNYARTRSSTGKVNYSKNDHLMDATRYLVYSGVNECITSNSLDKYYANSYKTGADDWILA